MLILFIYVISLIYNKKFKIYNIYIIIIFILISFIIFCNENFKIIFNNELFNNYSIFNNETSINLIKLYNFPLNIINILTINYLFYLLIIVVKITNFIYGPLRIKL